MYIPKKWHWIGPTAIAMIPFYLRTNFATDWTIYVFVDTPLAIASVAMSYYLAKAGVMYQGYMTENAGNVDRRQSSRNDAATARAAGLKPVPALAPVNVYQQTTQKLVFDTERQFAKTLLIMRDYKPNDEAVDLREEYWKRPNKFGSRDAYVLVRAKWEARNVIRKAAARRNAPYKVIDWRKVQLVADGEKLPPPPGQ